MKVNHINLWVRIFLAFFVILIFGVVTFGESSKMNAFTKKEMTDRDFKKEAVFLSKAEITNQIDRLMAEINSYEKEHGASDGEVGGKVYSAQETAHLIGLYQSIVLRLNYLESGNYKTVSSQWEGFQLTKTGEPYNEAQVIEAISRLKELNVPEAFLKGFRIFLLPYSVPDISGLGGVGFTMLSPSSNQEDPAGDLAVTLYHEIGHHIHLSFMPRETKAGNEEWNKYLQIRGSAWHGPGNVNTTAWSDSSEETFAEDFRMLFDKTQPFFGDVTLGDPRSNSKQAEKLKTFINGLAKEKVSVRYYSPWMPQDPYLSFWLQQGTVILSLWLVLGCGISTVSLFYARKGSIKTLKLKNHPEYA